MSPSNQQPFQKTPTRRNPKEEKNYSMLPMFLSNNAETDSKILRLLSCSGSHRNERQKPSRRSNFYPRNMQSYGFLNMKLWESSIKQKVKRSSEHYLLRWMKT